MRVTQRAGNSTATPLDRGVKQRETHRAPPPANAYGFTEFDKAAKERATLCVMESQRGPDGPLIKHPLTPTQPWGHGRPYTAPGLDGVLTGVVRGSREGLDGVLTGVVTGSREGLDGVRDLRGWRSAPPP